MENKFKCRFEHLPASTVIPANPGFALISSSGTSLEREEIVIGWTLDQHYRASPITLGDWNGKMPPGAIGPTMFGILYPDGMVHSPDDDMLCYGTVEQFIQAAREANANPRTDDDVRHIVFIPEPMWEWAKERFKTQDPAPYFQDIVEEARAADIERQQAAHIEPAGQSSNGGIVSDDAQGTL